MKQVLEENDRIKSEAFDFPPIKQAQHLKELVGILVIAWFLLAVAGSLFGVFDSKGHPPIALGAGVLLPIAAFAVWYRSSAAFRQLILNANLRFLTAAHTVRLVGIVFLVLYWRGILPGTFALPAGWGDIAIGATAPLLALALAPTKTFPKRTFVFWNAFGLLDLVTAVTFGILSSPTPVGILAGERTTAVMGQFPLSLIPTFFVPLLTIFHVISFVRVRSVISDN